MASTQPKVRLIAVVGELVDVDGFMGHFVGGDVVLDTDNAVKSVLGGGKVRETGLSFLLSPTFWRNHKRSKANHPDIKDGGNSKDGFNLGAVFIVSPAASIQPPPPSAPQPDGAAEDPRGAAACTSNTGALSLSYLFLENTVGDIADKEQVKLALAGRK